MKIVVTGATGPLGRHIIESLIRRGTAAADITAGGRDTAKLAALEHLGVATAAMDYDEPETLRVAFAGADTLMLVSASEPGQRVRQHRAAVDAAVEAGVTRIVYTSAPLADTTTLVLAPEHKETEELIAASGIPFTILRNNWYTENYLGALQQTRDTGNYSAGTGDGRVASASRSDYAEAAAVVLTSGDHVGSVYELAGDYAWTGEELAGAMAEVLGTEVRWLPVTADEQRAQLTAAGLDAGTVEFVVTLDGDIRDGALAFTDGTLSRLIGRPTTPLVEGLRSDR